MGYFIQFEVFLKVPMIIIMRFGENHVLEPKYIDIIIYINLGARSRGGGGVG